MFALAKFSALAFFFRRESAALGVVARLVRGHGARSGTPATLDAECAADVAAFRVTETRRGWAEARHFADLNTALNHAAATDGVVWELYIGPTGARNWWSLTPGECQQRVPSSQWTANGE